MFNKKVKKSKNKLLIYLLNEINFCNDLNEIVIQKVKEYQLKMII